VGRLGTSGPWTEIGAGPQTLNGTGELYLAMNDQLGAFGDNSGSVQVAIVANLKFQTSYSPSPRVIAGKPLVWTGKVTNNGSAPLTNVTLFASAASGLSTSHSDTPVWRYGGTGAASACSLQTAGTTTYSCVVPSLPASSFITVTSNVLTQGL